MNNYIHQYTSEKSINVFYEHDRFINEVLKNNEYGFYSLEGKQNLIVLDVGANMGSFTWSILPKIKHAYLIEPLQGCVDLIIKTIEANSLNNIEVFPIAMGNKCEMRGFCDIENSQTGSSGFLAGNHNTTVKVRDIETILNFIGIESVDLMKIDVECAEKEIFESESFSKVCSRIKAIIGERHGDLEIKTALEHNGYSYQEYGCHFTSERV